MYGRAGFALLRKRVILHPALPDHKIRGRATYCEHGHGGPLPARQRQNREDAAWWGAAVGPRAWVPITTAGDRAGMLRTRQGARNAEYLLSFGLRP